MNRSNIFPSGNVSTLRVKAYSLGSHDFPRQVGELEQQMLTLLILPKHSICQGEYVIFHIAVFGSQSLAQCQVISVFMVMVLISQ